MSSLEFTSATDCMICTLLINLCCELSGKGLLARLTLSWAEGSVKSMGRSSLRYGERWPVVGLSDLCQPTNSRLHSWRFKGFSYLAAGRWIVLLVED